MLGPLPRLHQLVVVATALAVFVGLGVWAGVLDSVPVLVSGGASLGVLLGTLSAWLLVHEPHDVRDARAHPRPRRR
ncbi:hypothetical protein [Nocardioides solisilvae]|uniref:hypothetical protein n=1 Tax=Nocardioides solisilvae TaxID=1542435 RepID=UPI0013A56EF8|nr:hypothetical protein [Nocardioides solisilvae]